MDLLSFEINLWTAVTFVLGIVVTILYHRKGQNKISLSYVNSVVRLVGGKSPEFPDDITLYFQNIKVETVSKNLLKIWNSGNKIINQEDVVESDSLRVKIEGDGKLLKSKILKSSREQSNFFIEEIHSDNIAKIKFDYIEPGEGCMLEILHTSEEPVKVECTIKGMKAGLRQIKNLEKNKKIIIRGTHIGISYRVFLWTLFGSTIALSSLAFADILIDSENLIFQNESKINPSEKLLFASFLAAYSFFTAFFLWRTRRVGPSELDI